MKAIISAYHEKSTCTWCRKDAECVSVEFEDGFLQKGPFCWKCLQQATRVHQSQRSETTVQRPAKPG